MFKLQHASKKKKKNYSYFVLKPLRNSEKAVNNMKCERNYLFPSVSLCLPSPPHLRYMEDTRVCNSLPGIKGELPHLRWGSGEHDSAGKETSSVPSSNDKSCSSGFYQPLNHLLSILLRERLPVFVNPQACPFEL